MSDDYISRQAVLDMLDDINNHIIDGYGYKHDWCVEWVKGLSSAQPEQRWTPCSERLPDEKDAGILKKLGINKRSDDVIATVDVNGARMTVTACTHDGKWDWNMKYAFPDFKVVAWMPLPKPPKGEE